MERERFLNILGLMDYRIFTIDENEHGFHIQAELITSPSCCAHCGHPKTHRHEVKPLPDAKVVYLGIDELYLLNQYRCVITDVHSHHIIDLLKNRKKATVISYLQGVPWSFSGTPKSPGEEQDTRSFFHFSMLY